MYFTIGLCKISKCVTNFGVDWMQLLAQIDILIYYQGDQDWCCSSNFYRALYKFEAVLWIDIVLMPIPIPDPNPNFHYDANSDPDPDSDWHQKLCGST
jgi:hypothetical protein